MHIYNYPMCSDKELLKRSKDFLTKFRKDEKSAYECVYSYYRNKALIPTPALFLLSIEFFCFGMMGYFYRKDFLPGVIVMGVCALFALIYLYSIWETEQGEKKEDALRFAYSLEKKLLSSGFVIKPKTHANVIKRIVFLDEYYEHFMYEGLKAIGQFRNSRELFSSDVEAYFGPGEDNLRLRVKKEYTPIWEANLICWGGEDGQDYVRATRKDDAICLDYLDDYCIFGGELKKVLAEKERRVMRPATHDEIRQDERYGSFTLLNEPCSFKSLFWQDIPVVQVHDSHVIDGSILGFVGVFAWKGGELLSLDGDWYDPGMLVYGYKWFEREDKEDPVGEKTVKCLDILVKRW